MSRVAEFLAAVAAASAAALTARYAGPVAVFPVTLAGLLPLLPGLSLTIAIGEVASGSLVAGASRLIGALTVLLSLGFGVAVGYRLVGAPAVSIAVAEPVTYGAPVLAAALVAVAAAMTVAFRARWRDLPIILIASLLAMASARWGAQALGPEFSALCGAFVVGITGAAYERLARSPAQIALLPGILLLVPGSVGFTGVQSLLDSNAIAGVQGVVAMFVVAVGIVTGLLLASVLAPTGTRPPAPTTA